MDQVSLEDVRASEGGVDNRSSVVVNIVASGGVAKPKGKAKAKSKSEGDPAASAARNLASLEKTLRGHLAQEVLLLKTIDHLISMKDANPSGWTWAGNFLTDCETAKQAIAKLKSTGFLAQFAAAALSPETLKAMKKQMGDEYHLELMRSTDAIKESIKTWSTTVGRVQDMAEAAGVGASAGGDDSGPAAPKSKKARKSGKPN